MNTEQLYSVQEKIWTQVFTQKDALGLEDLLLCGGTALSRFYLNHRVSYDLDFFTPVRFNPEQLHHRLARTGLTLLSPVFENREGFCRQLSGQAVVDGVRIKIDFVEDIFDGMFAVVQKNNVTTEELSGLYHRKIRTLSGIYSRTGEIKGARQAARDLFDLYVLSRSIEPVNQFIVRVNQYGANIPETGLINSLNTIPWIEMIDEFAELDVSSQWKQFDIHAIRASLEHDILKLQYKEENDDLCSPK